MCVCVCVCVCVCKCVCVCIHRVNTITPYFISLNLAYILLYS